MAWWNRRKQTEDVQEDLDQRRQVVDETNAEILRLTRNVYAEILKVRAYLELTEGGGK